MKKLKVKFPTKSLTAQEIMGNNKINSGKLLYNTDWYKNENFFTKEKTRKGTIKVDLEITQRNTTYSDIQKNLPKDNEILNFAEYLYIVKTYPEFRETLKGYNYIFTSSLDSDGYRVRLGGFDAGGVGVDGYWDDGRGGNLGVAGAREWFLKTGPLESSESLTLENFILDLKDLVKKYE